MNVIFAVQKIKSHRFNALLNYVAGVSWDNYSRYSGHSNIFVIKR